MRGLAEYTMLGRRQAIIVVLLCGFIPLLYLISGAVVALVNLRKGTTEGLLILLWSLIPAGFNWLMGDPMPLILMVGITVLAQVLRTTQSWEKVLVGAALLGIAAQSSLQLMPGYIAQLQMILEQAVNQQVAQGNQVGMSGDELVSALLSFFGAYHTLAAIACMAVARWWQAALYNPGGFRSEFHALRLQPGSALVLLALMIAGMAGVSPLAQWVNIISIVPMVAGLALLHGVIGIRKMASQWLVLVYLALIFMAPAIMAAGLLDSLLDVRKRMMNA